MKKLLGKGTSKLGAAIVPGPLAESDGKSYGVEPQDWAAGTGLASIMDDEPATMSTKGGNMIEEV